MKFIQGALLLISMPLCAAVSTNTNVLTVKAEVVTGSCDIKASDVDLGDLVKSEFAAGGAWANLSATSVGNVPTQTLKVSARCDSGSVAKTLVLSFKPQKAQLTGNQIFPNEYTGPTGRITSTTAAENIGVVAFYGNSNVLNKDNSSAVNITGYIGSTDSYTDYSFKVRYQKVDSAKAVTAGGVLSHVQISVSYK